MKEGWEYKKLGEVANFYRGLTYGKDDEAESSNVCVLRSNNIDFESMSLNFDEIKYLRPDFVIPDDKKLKGGSIFICMSNGSKQHVGKVAYIENDMDYAFGGFMGLIAPYKDVSSKYIYYVCCSSYYRRFLSSIGNGIGITNLKFSDLNNFSFPISSLAQQQKIVSELDLLSGTIEKQKAQLEELDILVQSIFYDMFGGKEWEKKKIKDIATVKIGPFGSALHQHDYISGGTPLVNPIHMANGKIIADNDFSIDDNKKKELSAYLLKENDIIFGRRGDIGRCALVTNKEDGYLCGTGSLFVRFIIEISPIYSLIQLSSNDIKQYLIDNARGATMLNLNSSIIEGIKVPLPPLPLQQEFASKIEAIESMKAKVRQSLSEAETLFNSRMDYYFN